MNAIRWIIFDQYLLNRSNWWLGWRDLRHMTVPDTFARTDFVMSSRIIKELIQQTNWKIDQNFPILSLKLTLELTSFCTLATNQITRNDSCRPSRKERKPFELLDVSFKKSSTKFHKDYIYLELIRESLRSIISHDHKLGSQGSQPIRTPTNWKLQFGTLYLNLIEWIKRTLLSPPLTFLPNFTDLSASHFLMIEINSYWPSSPLFNSFR